MDKCTGSGRTLAELEALKIKYKSIREVAVWLGMHRQQAYDFAMQRGHPVRMTSFTGNHEQTVEWLPVKASFDAWIAEDPPARQAEIKAKKESLEARDVAAEAAATAKAVRDQEYAKTYYEQRVLLEKAAFDLGMHHMEFKRWCSKNGIHIHEERGHIRWVHWGYVKPAHDAWKAAGGRTVPRETEAEKLARLERRVSELGDRPAVWRRRH